MRLWHYKLIPFLPDLQLVAQWRELNEIYQNRPNHILINYVYQWSDDNLHDYSDMVIAELKRRGHSVKLGRYDKYFADKPYSDIYIKGRPYALIHNNRYLLQNFYNLQEKYDRGQRGFHDEEYRRLEEFVKGETDGR